MGENKYSYAVYLDDVSFSYEDCAMSDQDADKPDRQNQSASGQGGLSHAVIKNLSLKIRPGEHVGIVGDSGCGKSTMLKMLAGLYEPDRGELFVGGEYMPEKIREQVALVMQGHSLFPLSIRDNITCGHEISEEKVWEACENASLTEWVRSLPAGLDTNVGERGNQVSGGQAQRIQIARALCKNAPVILLDEPVSALDQDTGHSVLESLHRLTEGRTVLHVTHHRETLDSSYVVYRMKEGRLTCEGD